MSTKTQWIFSSRRQKSGQVNNKIRPWESHLPGFKHPLAVPVVIHLVPPSQANHQPPRNILETKQGFWVYNCPFANKQTCWWEVKDMKDSLWLSRSHRREEGWLSPCRRWNYYWRTHKTDTWGQQWLWRRGGRTRPMGACRFIKLSSF